MRAEENKAKEKNKERQCLHQSRGKGCKEQEKWGRKFKNGQKKEWKVRLR